MARSQSSDASPFSAKGGLCDRTLRQMAHGRPTQRSRQPAITEYGFDQSLTNFEGMGPKLLPLTLKPGQDPDKPGRIWADAVRLGKGCVGCSDRRSRKALWKKRSPSSKRPEVRKSPFTSTFGRTSVHSPFWPPTAKWGDGSKRRLYLSVLEAMDEQLGKLFDFVRNDPRLADNTLILACSDNGAEKAPGYPGPFRGFKTHLFEGGIRSSLVVWGPGFIPSDKKEGAGKVNLKSVFSAVDLVPTILDLAGVPHPKGVQYDGESLPDVFARQKQKLPQTTALLSPSARPRLFLRSQGFTRSGRSLRKMEIALRV